MKVNIGYRVTVNIGNYESVQYTIGAEIDVKENLVSELKDKLEKYLEEEVTEKVIDIKKNGRKKFGFDTNIDDVLGGLDE